MRRIVSLLTHWMTILHADHALSGLLVILLAIPLLGAGSNSLGSFRPLLQPEPPALSVDEYWKLAQSTRDLAASLKDAPVDQARASFQEIAPQWEAIHAVQVSVEGEPTPRSIPLDPSMVIALLRADTPEPEKLQALLEAQLAGRSTWPDAQARTGELQQLQYILSRPEFQWQPQQPSPLGEWLNRMLRWLGDLLDRLLGNSGVNLSLRLGNYVFIGLGVLLIIGVLLYAWRSLRRSLAPESALADDQALEEENLTADSALKKAHTLSISGDYRQAVRYLYLSALLLLDEHGLLRYDRSRTNREYLRSVAHLPDLAANLRQVVDTFDRVWYGYQPLDQSDFERYAEQVARLRQQREQK